MLESIQRQQHGRSRQVFSTLSPRGGGGPQRTRGRVSARNRASRGNAAQKYRAGAAPVGRAGPRLAALQVLALAKSTYPYRSSLLNTRGGLTERATKLNKRRL